MPLITKGARALEVVARYGSIRKASEHINAAPSALNKQILNLEQEYGTPLFERLPRGMRLTEAGHVLVGQIRAWQDDNHRASAAVETLKGRGGGYVKIGIMECLADQFLSQAFGKLRAMHEDVSLRAIVGGTTDLAARLMAGEIDIAVSFNVPHDVGLRTTQEVKLGIGAVLPPDHPLIRCADVQIRDLWEYPLVLADETLTIGPIVNGMLQRTAGEDVGAVMTNSISVLKSLVKQNQGISLLTRIDIQKEIQSGELIFKPLTGNRMFTTLSVAIRDEKALSPSSRQLVEIICSMLNDLAG